MFSFIILIFVMSTVICNADNSLVSAPGQFEELLIGGSGEPPVGREGDIPLLSNTELETETTTSSKGLAVLLSPPPHRRKTTTEVPIMARLFCQFLLAVDNFKETDEEEIEVIEEPGGKLLLAPPTVAPEPTAKPLPNLTPLPTSGENSDNETFLTESSQAFFDEETTFSPSSSSLSNQEQEAAEVTTTNLFLILTSPVLYSPEDDSSPKTSETNLTEIRVTTASEINVSTSPQKPPDKMPALLPRPPIKLTATEPILVSKLTSSKPKSIKTTKKTKTATTKKKKTTPKKITQKSGGKTTKTTLKKNNKVTTKVYKTAIKKAAKTTAKTTLKKVNAGAKMKTTIPAPETVGKKKKPALSVSLSKTLKKNATNKRITQRIPKKWGQR